MSHIGRLPCDEAAIRTAPPGSPCAQAAKPWVLAAAIIGSSMAFIDGTVVNVALPAIQRDLGASAFQMQWVVESYQLFLAALMLVGGALGDRFGRRRIFVLGVAVFAAASVCCGLSREVTQLIIARGVQGVGAALLVPGSLALISASFDQKERGRAIGTWSGFSAITTAAGPLLGGFLVDRYSWDWAFLLNIPFALAAVAIAWLRVPESRNDSASDLDWPGAMLATLGLGGIVYALVEAPSRGWNSVAVVFALLMSAIALGLFAIVEMRSTSPMLPLSLFRSRNFGGANLLTLLLYSALGGGLFYFPLNLIQVQGYSATAAGAAFLPFVLILFVLSRWSGSLVDRFGPKLPLVIGPIIAGIGFGLFALPATNAHYWSSYFPAVGVLGLGMAISVAPLTTTVMNSLPENLAGTASGVNNAVSRAAGLLAIAAFGGVMAWAFAEDLHERLAESKLPPEAISFLESQRGKLAGVEPPAGLSPDALRAAKESVGGSFVAGFRWLMLLCAGLALMSAASAALLIEGRPRGRKVATAAE
jgi:EmrB/QacA subfamily drug resistance transporter